MAKQQEFELFKILDQQGYYNSDLLARIINVSEKNSIPGDLLDLMAARAAHTLSTVVGIYMIGELGKDNIDNLTNKEIEEYYQLSKEALDILASTEGKVIYKKQDRKFFFPIVEGYMKDGFKGSGDRLTIIQHTDKRVTLHSEPNGGEWHEYWVMVKGKWQQYDPKIHGDVNFDVKGHFAPRLSTLSW